MKTLVVYYSRTGQTTRVAKEIASRCDAHLDAIQSQHLQTTWASQWRYNWQSLMHAEPPIGRPGRNPANYDLVVIGVPITRVGLAPPVRSYVRQYGDRIRQIALFCAEGAGTDERGFDELCRLYGKQPVATFALARRRLPTIASRAQLMEFVQNIQGGLPVNQTM